MNCFGIPLEETISFLIPCLSNQQVVFVVKAGLNWTPAWPPGHQMLFELKAPKQGVATLVSSCRGQCEQWRKGLEGIVYLGLAESV